MPLPFIYPLSREYLGTIWKLCYYFFSFNVLYTFVLLIDMIAFLVFNSVGGAGGGDRMSPM